MQELVTLPDEARHSDLENDEGDQSSISDSDQTYIQNFEYENERKHYNSMQKEDY